MSGKATRKLLILLFALMALTTVPAESLAGQQWTFGSTLKQRPTTGEPASTCDTSGANIDVGPCTRVALGFADTGAVKGRIRAPMSGFIRRVRIRSGAPGLLHFKLVRLRRLDAQEETGEARAVSRGKLLRLKGRGHKAKRPIESFRIKLKVRKGDYLALDGSAISALVCRAGVFQQLIFQPPLGPFGPWQPSTERDDCTLLVQATIRR